MLATLVIGLREGLEAALIVGIIAAFLRNNGKSLVPMWVGVTLAVMLSVAVGVGLKLIEQALPQAAQEGLETIIGAVAVFFVTGMIVWMSTHAHQMKQQLETEAAHALGRASTYALASMAFLAVLKEGFETSVFLLATFSAAQSAGMAAIGAIAGLLMATGIGWGIYAGGVKLNLSRFFRYTAAFLVLVAAGLVVSSLRTAHEAGWLNAGQLVVMNLDWLVAPGTVQSALITGVLGIPADPRLVEVLGWCAYLIPVALYLYWPKSQRPGPRAAAMLKVSIAGVAAATALGLALGYPTEEPRIPARATLVPSSDGGGETLGTARLSTASENNPAELQIRFSGGDVLALPLRSDARRQQQRDGMLASTWHYSRSSVPADAPTTLTLQQVVALSGGRVPIGLNPRQHSGPFTADWRVHRSIRAWTAHGALLDATGQNVTTIQLSGGGLLAPRTLSVDAPDLTGSSSGWEVAPAYVHHVAAQLKTSVSAHIERRFWAIRFPILLGLIALVLILFAWRSLARNSRASDAGKSLSTTPSGQRAENIEAKGATHAT